MAYTSKYEEILIDKSNQSVNPSLKHELTVEEYFDLLHHTHTASSIVQSSDTGAQLQSSEEILDKLNESLDALRTQSELITNLTAQIEAQNETISNMQKSIDTLNNYVDQDIFINTDN